MRIVEPRTPRAFQGDSGPRRLLVPPIPDPDNRRTIDVTPKRLDGTTTFLDAMKARVRVIERKETNQARP